jgi:hypothetical protein
LAEGSPASGEQTAYCTVYEIESDDPAAVVARLGEAAQNGKLHRSDASGGNAKMFLWEEQTPRVAHP